MENGELQVGIDVKANYREALRDRKGMSPELDFLLTWHSINSSEMEGMDSGASFQRYQPS